MQRSITPVVRRRGAAIAGLLAAALLLTGCSTPAAAPTSTKSGGAQTMSELIAAAKAEGSLTLYGSPSQTALQATADLFTQKYGITVNVVRLVSGVIESRYPTEKSSGAPTADVIMENLSAFFPQAIKDGIITPLQDLKIPGYPWNLPKKFLLPQYGTAVIGLQIRGITYNTDHVKPGEIKDWPDVLNPKFTGHVGVPDPTSAPVYVGHWYTIGQNEGGAQEFLEKVQKQLAPNGVYASGAPSTAAVGSGEVWVVPMNINSLTYEVQQQGAPIKFVVPPETTADQQSLQVNSKPAHPNAAKLFVAFMMSKEGSMELAKAGHETSPFDTANLPKKLLSWPIEVAADQKDNVNKWLTGR
jgi:iron(III) transport system substrate-binding protein